MVIMRFWHMPTDKEIAKKRAAAHRRLWRRCGIFLAVMVIVGAAVAGGTPAVYLLSLPVLHLQPSFRHVKRHSFTQPENPMFKQTALLFVCALALAACDSEKPKTTPQSTEARADNPMLKFQDETVGKAEKELNKGLENTQQRLNDADKQ